jgi:hypothetical protein
MTETHINRILAIPKNDLIKVVPTWNQPINVGTYNYIAAACSPEWSLVVKGLNLRMITTTKRARNHSLKCNIDLRYLCEQWIEQQGRCRRTGLVIRFDTGTVYERNPYGCSIDRIDNDRGYEQGNIELLVGWANNAKGAWSEDVFEQMITEAYRRIQKQNKRSLI